MRIILVIGFIFFVEQNLYSQVEDSSSFKLFINPLILNDQQRSEITEALVKLAIHNNQFDSTTVALNDNYYSIIHKQYNYYDGLNPQTCNVLVDALKELNDLKDAKAIYVGQSITYPKLPRMPKARARYQYVQVLDFVDDRRAVASIDEVVSGGISWGNPNEEKDASLWVYNLKRSDYELFIKSLNKETLTGLEGKGFIGISDYEEPIMIDAVFPSTVDTSLTFLPGFGIRDSVKVRNYLNNTPLVFDDYYLLDFFDKTNCSHGKKVMSVLMGFFNKYLVDPSKVKIKPIPINYFQNEEIAIDFLEQYYSTEGVVDRSQHLAIIQGKNQLEKLKRLKASGWAKNCQNCIPEVYLNALFKGLYKNKPDIISTSFYTLCFDNDAMPDFKLTPTNLIAAVLDDPERKIEDLLLDYDQATNGPSAQIQPIKGLLMHYQSAPALIIGCKVGEGKYYGMYSETGQKVTSIGKGIGYFVEGNCLMPNEKGSSFAVPEIGAKLYLAKAYWTSKLRKRLDGIEARYRVLVSSDLEESFVGKFASGGTLNLEKLLQTSDSWYEDNSGEIVSCKIGSSSFIAFDEDRTTFRRRDGISGLYLINDKFYCFFESTLSWRSVSVKEFRLELVVQGSSKIITDPQTLKETLKQIVLLTKTF